GRSHGFRPGRGCHTALTEVAKTWKGTTWFIELDIAQCFDRLDHSVMLGILSENIRDNRFLRLIKGMLRAGYLEDWVWNATLSGAPQGSLCAAAHKEPYEQCWVMRSAGLPGLVGAGSASERCA
ncbi:MAG TPA: reverse transcriptase/maturase family protein, partial [Streptosporangiaceae bacterium]|nr:reverse transcriptase/maturase family protein [Streptosporangiaceae bacterium]